MTRASNALRRATDADSKHLYNDAVANYINGVEILMQAVSNEPNALARNMILAKISTYVSRLKTLAAIVHPELVNQNSVVSTSYGNVSSSSSNTRSSLSPPQPPTFYATKPQQQQQQFGFSNPNSASSSNDGNKSTPMQLSEEDSGTAKMRVGLQNTLVDSRQIQITWDDVGGLDTVKKLLQQTVVMPIRYPQLFDSDTGRHPWHAILLYGPPGTGKSQLARAVATESKARFFSISSAELLSKYLGESEKLVSCFFDMCRQNTPAVIFVDEVDSLCSSRTDQDSEAGRRVKTQFLTQMDGVGKTLAGILMLAATNIPWMLDAGIRRRFEKRLYIGLPDRAARIQMLTIHTRSIKKLQLTPEEIGKLSDMTAGYSGSDIKSMVNSALMLPINRIQRATHFLVSVDDGLYRPTNPDSNEPNAQKISWDKIPDGKIADLPTTYEDFAAAISQTKPTVSQNDVIEHDKWTKEFGEDGK